MYLNIERVVLKDVNKYVAPVHVAAFFMCPALREDVLCLEKDDPEEFGERMEDMLDVLVTMYRRVNVDGKFREEVLAEDDAGLGSVRETFRKEYQDYLMASGSFSKVINLSSSTMDSKRFWRFNCGTSALRYYGISLASAHPSTSFVERNHKVVANVMSEKRASLGSARGLGLIMMACRTSSLRNRSAMLEPEAEFMRQLQWFRTMSSLNDASEKLLDDLKERWAKEDETAEAQEQSELEELRAPTSSSTAAAPVAAGLPAGMVPTAVGMAPAAPVQAPAPLAPHTRTGRRVVRPKALAAFDLVDLKNEYEADDAAADADGDGDFEL
jgi:hypothetical protein